MQVLDGYVSNQVDNNEKEWSEFISKDRKETSENFSINLNDQSEEEVDKNASKDSIDNDTDDEWCETTELSSGVMDTFLQEPDITEDGDRIVSFAPGEGNRPLGIFTDKDSQIFLFLLFIVANVKLIIMKDLCPFTMCKLKKLQIRQIQRSASLSLRKCKTKGKTYTARDLKSESCVDKLINLDEGFRVLRNLRGSPPYFERCKKDLFAMIRQLGKPTWFCSFSAAETRWIHLIKFSAVL